MIRKLAMPLTLSFLLIGCGGSGNKTTHAVQSLETEAKKIEGRQGDATETKAVDYIVDVSELRWECSDGTKKNERPDKVTFPMHCDHKAGQLTCTMDETKAMDPKAQLSGNVYKTGAFELKGTAEIKITDQQTVKGTTVMKGQFSQSGGQAVFHLGARTDNAKEGACSVDLAMTIKNKAALSTATASDPSAAKGPTQASLSLSTDAEGTTTERDFQDAAVRRTRDGFVVTPTRTLGDAVSLSVSSDYRNAKLTAEGKTYDCDIPDVDGSTISTRCGDNAPIDVKASLPAPRL
ncbi:MAG TPA: hypothetical protein VI895_05440 [Bdellovibrionota bacterium]|nr:hypothetical protein [Bdellovibrionota bacterium]